MDEPAETGTASKDCIFSSTKNCLILKSHFVQWQWQEKAEPDGPRTAATSSSGCEDSTFFFKRWRLNLFFFLCDCECELGCPPLHPKWVQFPSLGHGFGNPVHLLNFDFLPYFFSQEKQTSSGAKDCTSKKKVMFELTYCWILVSFHASGRTLCKAPHPRTASCLKAVDWMRHATICWTLYSHRADKHNTLCWKAHHIVLKSTRQCAEKQHCFF